jgi:hypothetical protein
MIGKIGMSKTSLIKLNDIQNLIYTIRDKQVMLDSALARLYGVEIKRLNEQVKRNIDRFPSEFMFQLSKEEYESQRSQIATLETGKPLRSQIVTLEKSGSPFRKWVRQVCRLLGN